MAKQKDVFFENYTTLKIAVVNAETKEEYSTLVKVSSLPWFKDHETAVKLKAIQFICTKNKITGEELLTYGFNKIKVKIVTPK